MQSAQKGYVFLLIVVVLAALSGWLYNNNPYKYGLDVRGGVRFTLAIEFDRNPAKAAEQRKNLPSIRQNLVRVLNSRVGAALGVVESSVQSKGESEFIVEIPGFTDIESARSTIVSTAKLVAYHADNVATTKRDFRPFMEAGEETIGGVPVVTFANKSNPEKRLVPGDPAYARMIADWDPILEGDELARASWRIEAGNRTVPVFNFSESGARKMEAWSSRYSQDGEYLAFVLDGKVLSFAPLKEGAILSNEAFIDGTFEPSYVTNLANLLNAGALPVDLVETSATQVSPTIGQFALDQMVRAGLISFGLTVLFLLGYYVFPGFVALIALCLYVLFTLTVMKLIDATFSLAAIAGFILSVGMAVDANILVFERVKEELRAGKTLTTAVELGFKRAFPAILDSNVCTILTSSVLFFLGQGAVKGFASTLIIGVALSLFTAVVVTRSLLVFLVSSGIGNNPKVFGLNRNWFGEELERNANIKPVKIMSRSRLFFMISIFTIIPGLIFISLGGIKPNVEFRGGIEAEYVVDQSTNVTAASISSGLERAGYKSPIVKVTNVSDQSVMNLDLKLPQGFDASRTRTEVVKGLGIPASPIRLQIDGSNVQMSLIKPVNKTLEPAEIQSRLADAGFLEPKASVNKQNLTIVAATIDPKPGTDPESPEVKSEVTRASGLSGEPVSFSNVGPTIQAETLRNAYLGIVFSAVLIVFWLTLRFGLAIGNFRKGLMFGFSAIFALVHDVLVVIGVAAIVGYFANWQISTLFVTAMLTVIGFSVHDTIVIFDRVRENLTKPLSGETFEHLCDRSVTQSFARSLNTSITVIATLIMLIWIGTPTIDLKLFCVTMLTGIISGTYSSIFNATPILYLWDKAIEKRKGPDATLIADSIKEINRKRAQQQTIMAAEGAQSYGTVKRRRSVREQARQDLDE